MLSHRYFAVDCHGKTQHSLKVFCEFPGNHTILSITELPEDGGWFRQPATLLGGKLTLNMLEEHHASSQFNSQ